MNYCHKHNLVDPARADAERKFGIRVTLRADDTFARMLGEDWERIHWYASRSDRDIAFRDMSGRHAYSRDSDAPTHVLEKIER